MFKAPAQCTGLCASGKRCSITASSKLKDNSGHLVAAPLEYCGRCLFHLELFRPARVDEAIRVFYLDSARNNKPFEKHVFFSLLVKDFETSGLDPSVNNIVEIGLLDDAGARFQTVVCPPVFVEGPAVHAIPNSRRPRHC